MARTNTAMIDRMVEGLYMSARIDRADFERKAGDNSIRKTFDLYVKPFIAKEEEKKMRTGLCAIVSRQVDPNAKIEHFPEEQLRQVLYLEVPKKVLQYVASAVPIASGAIPETKQRQKRGNLFKSSSMVYKDKRANLPKLGMTEECSPEPAAKRTRHAAEDDIGLISLAVEEEAPKFSKAVLPSNFFDVASEMFQEFLFMEIDDIVVSSAFFATITNQVCANYGLETFAETSTAFPVIERRLKARHYISIEDFLYDFEQLFSNIIKYYPKGHAAVEKAEELRTLFDTRWAEARKKLR
ncbi:hypothetical protein B484DRAFT_255271 [Ochromonadaceae sp. CCMP2298]|nr:hypothetical protein B484DRAFT_255271 [Ochromonadaceae sp. CCMP2298]|mmetsp:Transcript_32455/g.69943  ORF Transcript_32455/g.69943 Transcript_32455/m.69943 type:complete len:297 (+) Transcript_32455:176-1066(+)